MSTILREAGSLAALSLLWQKDNAEWVGFEQLTPLQLAISGAQNEIPKKIKADARYQSYTSTDSELDSVLIEAQRAAQDGEEVAIIIADLADQFIGVRQRIYLLGLNPALFHITASASLAEHPLVQSLMRHIAVILGLESDAATYIDWYQDALVDANDYFRRMLFFEALKESIISNFDISYLVNWLIQRDEGNHELMPWVSELDQFRAALEQEHDIVTWHEFIEFLLRQTRWAEGVQFDSEATQALDAFHKQLIALSDIDLVGVRFNFKSYWQLLQQRLKTQAFQIKAASAPISISGWREIGGLCFDRVFVINQHSISWPAMQSPNALLPLTLQKSYAMKGQGEHPALGSDATAQSLLKRLSDTKAKVVMSYALKDGEEERQSASQLVKFAGSLVSAKHQEVKVEALNYREVNDDALKLLRQEPLRVGAIDKMFQCPFTALAQHRLGLNWQNSPSKGISPKTIGKLVDRTMQYLVPQSTQIKTKQFDEESAVPEVVTILKSLLVTQLGYVSHGQIEAICRRIISQAMSWIERYDFADFSDYVPEETVEGEIANRPIKGRIDRHDKVEGMPRIIDYKSGSKRFTHNMWRLDALRDLQLPIYAVITQELAMIGIAHIGLKDEVGFYKEELNAELLAGYQHIIEDLSKQYIEGWYPLAPRTKNQCERCQYALLCRQDIWLGDAEEEL